MNFYSIDLLASFDDAGDAGNGAGDAGNGAGDAGNGAGDAGDAGNGAGDGGGNGVSKTFTQDEVNRFLADDRRKHTEKYSTLETSYQELLTNQNLGQEERESLEQKLEEMQARNRTKEQQLAYDRDKADKEYKEQLEQARTDSKTWENRYTERMINQELLSAAVDHDAYNAQQIVTQLKSQTELTEQLDATGKPTGELVPMVKMKVANEDTGAQEDLSMTPSEAVEYMKKNPEKWGNFFKNNIREGIGSASATGGAAIGDGTVDVTKITDAQYFKLRKENPESLGLKPLKN